MYSQKNRKKSIALLNKISNDPGGMTMPFNLADGNICYDYFAREILEFYGRNDEK